MEGQGTVLCPADNNDYHMTADAIKYNNDTVLSNQYIYDNDGNLVRQIIIGALIMVSRSDLHTTVRN